MSKISPDGSSFVFSTYVGGSQEDKCNALAVDASGCVYVAGSTKSYQFPTASARAPTRS